MAVQVVNNHYVVIFHLDTGFIDVVGVYDDWRTAYGSAIMSLDNYAETQEEWDTEQDLYFTTIYRLEGGENFGISLRAHGSDDKDLADVWILPFSDLKDTRVWTHSEDLRIEHHQPKLLQKFSKKHQNTPVTF